MIQSIIGYGALLLGAVIVIGLVWLARWDDDRRTKRDWEEAREERFKASLSEELLKAREERFMASLSEEMLKEYDALKGKNYGTRY
jgi:hypothetical protein